MILRPVAPPVEYGITKRLARAGNAAIAFLRSLGTSAHVWLPGANGVSVASLPSNNYLLSGGSTGYSTVDGVDGLTLDGMGSVSATETVTNGDVSAGTTGWAGLSATLSWSSGKLRVTNTPGGHAEQVITTGVGKTYVITGTQTLISGSGNHNFLVRSDVSAVLAQKTAAGSMGTVSMTFVATSTTSKVQLRTEGSDVSDWDNISVKEYTGIHLTQPTTANKPLVRRGAYNQLKYSNDLGNAASWIVASCTVTGGVLTATAGAAAHYTRQSMATLSGVNTFAVDVKRVNNDWVFVCINDTRLAYFNTATGLFGTVAAEYTAYSATLLSDGYYRIQVTSSSFLSGNTGVGITSGNGTSSFTAAGTEQVSVRYAQLENVTTAGDYTPTTATPASNPSAGKYWWSLDGSNDSLLSGNLGFTNACTIVIAGRVNSLAATQMLFAETTNGVQVSIATDGSVSFAKVGDAALVATAAGVVVAGVPFVLTARLSAGTADIRKNGAQSATAASATVFAAVTGARIGTAFDGTTSPTGGALGWVVPLPTALSDADCLMVERLVSSQFPNGPVF